MGYTPDGLPLVAAFEFDPNHVGDFIFYPVPDGGKSGNEKVRGNGLKMHGNVRKLYFFDFWRPIHGSKGPL